MNKEQTFSKFYAQWVHEFARSVETATGEKPIVTQVAIDLSGVPDGQTPDRLWWKQTFEEAENFATWVGADEACWSALGEAASGSGDPKQAYLEIVTQANQSLAAVLSAKLVRPLLCLEGAVEALPELNSAELSQVRVTFRGNVLPPMILAWERTAERILASVDPAGGSALQPAALQDAAKSGIDLPMLARLMDLQLPVSVLLGRATLPIREILKISPGSLIELDRHLGDFVEVTIYGIVVARGEIVSVKGNYGVRIKEIISRQDRLALHNAA